MPHRFPGLALVLLGLGCHALEPVGAAPLQPAGPHQQLARQLWEEGQKAMAQGQHDRAITLYEQSLTASPQLARNHLSIAAAFLEKGDDGRAAPHLARYVEAHPEHLIIRVQYAELLWRLKRGREAQRAFEKAIAVIQDDLPPSHLIHCHTRVMQIAEAEESEYDEHLHRGIGLMLLARERSEQSVEGLLCRAAGELTLAHVQKPDEARPCWYLYQVWSRLAQRQPAQRSLREAIASAPFTYLTPAEQRELHMSCSEDVRK